MQTDLQLLLLIVGMVVGVLIVFNGLRQKRSRQRVSKGRHQFQKKVLESVPAASKKSAPIQMGGDDPLMEGPIKSVVKQEANSKPEALKPALVLAPDPASEPSVIMLVLLPRHMNAFSGKELQAAFETIGLRYGKRKVFQRYRGNDPSQSVCYSVASLVEPGIFDQETMSEDEYRGIILWMLLKSGIEATAFEGMLEDAKHLAQMLNAVLCDEKRQQLTVQAIADIRARIEVCLNSESNARKTN